MLYIFAFEAKLIGWRIWTQMDENGLREWATFFDFRRFRERIAVERSMWSGWTQKMSNRAGDELSNDVFDNEIRRIRSELFWVKVAHS